jgi:glycosyltransferase involved in cell wall biosynthesis
VGALTFARSLTGNIRRCPMRQTLLFLEQQSWRSGAERVLEEVLRAVQPEFTPLVAFPGNGPFPAELRRLGVETLLFPLGRYRSGPKPLGDMVAFGPRSLRCAFQLSRVIRQRNVRLVYINSPRCLAAGVIAARLTARPSLFHLHMTMTRRADLWLAAHSARYATKIVACSKTSASALSNADHKLERMLQVVYNPVRKPIAARIPRLPGGAGKAPLLGSGRVFIGQVGRITPQKGQHVLLKAVGRLKNRGLDIHIVFVGGPEENNADDAAYDQFLKRLARNLGLEDTVHWAGYQPDPDAFYAIFDAVVIPSTVSEGLPLVALEAMQWGVPVIGSRLGGIPEIVSDGVNGFLALPGNDEKLADCLEPVLKDATLRARLRAGARASIDERFSVDNFHRQIRSAVSELCPTIISNPRENSYGAESQRKAALHALGQAAGPSKSK